MRQQFKATVFTILVLLSLLLFSQSVWAVTPQQLQAVTGKGKTNEVNQGQDIQIPENLDSQQVDAFLATLSDTQVRQVLAQKLKQEITESQQPTPEEKELRRRGPVARVFFQAGQVASIALSRLGAVFTGLTTDSNQWSALLKKLSGGKGVAHLLLTLLIVGLIITCGAIVDRLFRRYTEDIRRSILTIAPLGRLQKFGRFFSRMLLDALGICAYMLTTFILFVLVYEKGEASYNIASISIIGSYYVIFFIFAARIIFAPKAPSLRLLPIKDTDAVFLYRWIIGITVVTCVIAITSIIFREEGISEQLFQLLYSTSGSAVVLLLIWMIWQSRERVAQAIGQDTDEGTCKPSTLREKLAKSWHFFAILYVIGTGVYWQANVLLEGKGDVVNLIISIFLIPIFIGLDQWGQRLLKIASGELPETFDLSGTDTAEAVEDQDAAIDAEIAALQQEDKKTDMKHYVPLIKRAYRVLLLAFLFFILLRLWGIDLPIGRVFTSHALSIVVVFLLGFLVWQFIKVRIDRKLQEEMPETDEDMEEGGAGGSRAGTLLLLLRKFALSVLFVIVALIILSSMGVNIGPLIAGAGVIGLAIGFGAQTLVKDIISGVFFLVDDAFRVGDYVETAGMKGSVEHISLRSLRLRHPRGMVHTIPFGDMGTVTNLSRDYIITKLDIRVRYDTDLEKVRKIVKKINMEIQADEVMGPNLLDKIKSQGVREMDDSAMIMRVKFKTIPGEQFVIRREVYRRIQEYFSEAGIEFAHRNVTVYLPEDKTQEGSEDKQAEGAATPVAPDRKLVEEAGAAAAIAAIQAEEEAKKPKV